MLTEKTTSPSLNFGAIDSHVCCDKRYGIRREREDRAKGVTVTEIKTVNEADSFTEAVKCFDCTSAAF